MTIDCFGNNTSTEVKATSGIFHIFDYPTTGLRVSQETTLKYAGKAEAVEAIIAGFDKDMGTMTCTGCRSAGEAQTLSSKWFLCNQFIFRCSNCSKNKK